MSKPDTPPFSHPIEVAAIPRGGLAVRLDVDEAARERIARDMNIPSVPALAARLHLTPTSGGGVRVTGELQARVVQICVVTLEPFESPVREEIEVEFAEAGPADVDDVSPGEEIEITDLDAPDPIVDGRIDLGAVTAEFLALALDPYPRKPDARLDFEEPDPQAASPFAALRVLAKPEPEVT